jgi:hypothetical protein
MVRGPHFIVTHNILSLLVPLETLNHEDLWVSLPSSITLYSRRY